MTSESQEYVHLSVFALGMPLHKATRFVVVGRIGDDIVLRNENTRKTMWLFREKFLQNYRQVVA